MIISVCSLNNWSRLAEAQPYLRSLCSLLHGSSSLSSLFSLSILFLCGFLHPSPQADLSAETKKRVSYLLTPFLSTTALRLPNYLPHACRFSPGTRLTSDWNTAQTQGRNIRQYATYLTERARAYRDTKRDWVREKEGRLEKLTVDNGLLRETEVVQHQLTALLKCDVSTSLEERSR